MRRNSVKSKPRIQTDLDFRGSFSEKELVRQLQEYHGVGAVLQDERGGTIPVRLTTKGQLEYLKGGKWTTYSGAASAVSARAMSMTPIRTSTTASSAGHNRKHRLDGTQDHEGIPGAVEDNFAAFDAGGMLKDSGSKASDFAPPDPSSTAAALDGTGAAGTSDDYSRGDHKHEDSARHSRAHDMDSASDHSAADAGDYGKYLKANDDTGAPEWAEAPVGGAEVSDDIPLGNTSPASAGSSADASRSDHKHPDYALLLDETWERVIKGTLDTGAAAGTTTYQFGSDAGDNSGIAGWSGSWSAAAAFRSTTTGADYFEIIFRTSGGTVVLNDGGGGNDTGVSVLLNGAAYATWNQNTSATQNVVVSAGIAKIRCVASGGMLMTMAIGSIQIPQIPYQGIAVSGDVVDVAYVPSLLYVTTCGTGNTMVAATKLNRRMGEAVMQRLPLGTADADSTFARVSCLAAGETMALPALGWMGYTPKAEYAASETDCAPMRRGVRITFSSTAGTRGRLTTCGETIYQYGKDLASTSVHLCAMPLIVRVVTAGAGSRFKAGDLALCVVTRSFSGTSGTLTAVSLNTYNTTAQASDLFIIPSSLYTPL